MKNSMHLLFILGLLLASCNGKNQQGNSGESGSEMAQHDHHQEKAHPQETMPSDAQQVKVKKSTSNANLIEAYLEIKGALVEGKSDIVARESGKLSDSLKQVSPGQLNGKGDKYIEVIEKIKVLAGKLTENKADIASQRENFEALSRAVKSMVIEMGSDRTLYQTYCPMYNNNEGGMWLSASPEVKNPFYGDKMLSCGRVQEVLFVDNGQ